MTDEQPFPHAHPSAVGEANPEPPAKKGKPRMGRELRIVIHPTVSVPESRQIQRWAGKRPIGHAIAWLIRHARKSGFRVRDYTK